MQNKQLSKASQRKIDKALRLASRPTKQAANGNTELLSKALHLQFVRG
jgi:hypothetical protein